MAGVSVQIDVENDLVIDNVHLDIDKVSAQMGFWGDVHSSAEEEAIMADSHYRHWRANLAKTLAESDGKLAEWKVKNEIEAAKEFLQFKTLIARCQKNVTLAKSQFESYRAKAGALQSKGANLRASLEAPTSTRTTSYEDRERSVDSDSDSETVAENPRASRLKAQGIFGKKEKK